MKKMIALMCLYAGLATAVSAQLVAPLNVGAVTGSRICLQQAYDWHEDSPGTFTVTQGDPFYCGGWTVTIEGSGNELTLVGGITPYRLNQPVKVNYSAGTVILEAGDEPFVTQTGSSTTVSGGVTTKIDTVRSFYVVNEDWMLNDGNLANVTGEILADGRMHFADGFAYYIETSITTTITDKDGSVRTFTDEMVTMSPLYRDTWLVVPNGKHEFVSEYDDTSYSVDVYIRQSGDTVWVTNLYGYGAPSTYMLLDQDGNMTYPGQMVRDIPDTMSPNGSGLWINTTLAGGVATPGNAGHVTPTVITWGMTTPWDNTRVWDGWYNNRLYFTDGSTFVIPTEPTGIRGDVNKDNTVSIADVTALIDALLSGNFQESDTFSVFGADCNQDQSISIADVTALIDFLLSGTW